MDVLLGNRQFLTCTYFYLSFGVYRFKYKGRGNRLTAFGTDYKTLDFRAEIAECLMPAFIQTTFSHSIEVLGLLGTGIAFLRRRRGVIAPFSLRVRDHLRLP